MINSELLKEAIADAKAVRATALANAKAALEEAFAPRFEAMFADKLKEEAEEEQEEGLQEVEAPNQVSGAGGEAKGPATKPVSKGQPKTPKGGAGDTDFKAVQVGLGPKDVPKLGKKVNETAEEEEEEGKMQEVAEEEEEGKKMDEEFGLTQEDLDEIISELENEVADEEEGKKVDTTPAPAPEEEPAAEEPHAEPDGDEGGGMPPQLQKGGEEGGEPEVPVSAEPGSEVDINLGPEAGAEAGAPPVGMNAGLPGEEQPPAVPQGIPGQVPPQPGDEDDENINLEELLAALNEESEEEEEEEGKKMDEIENHGVPKKDQESKASVKGYPKTGPEKTSPGSHQVGGKNHNISGKGNIGTGAVGGLEEVTKYKVALKESYKTIEFLRGQINEVNLLNAKLLYTNKLFKEFAGVLDDSYRMKIVESFDLTKSVREVKLAYALLAESLNFGTQMAKAPAKQATKPAPAKGQVKQITEGFASKPVSSTKPSQLITEGNEMALRFKKLAGIKEAQPVKK
jgi:hypothetical protein